MMKKTKWILLAEDDAPLAELTTLALAPDKLDCEMIVARDGAEALDCLYHRGGFRTCPDGDPVLVLLDLKMPKVDGLEVLRRVKSDPRLKHIPVVMFTSSREMVDVSRSYQLGVNAYVVKSADFREFSETLEQVGRFWVTLNELPLPAAPGQPKARGSPQLAAV